MAQMPKDDLKERPLGELFRQFTEDVSTLIKQELQLARVEMMEKAKGAGVGVGMVGAAGVLGVLALAALTAAAILALAIPLDGWAAALIVAAVYGLVAGALALAGRRKVKQAAPPVPDETMETVKEDIQWLKQRSASGRS